MCLPRATPGGGGWDRASARKRDPFGAVEGTVGRVDASAWLEDLARLPAPARDAAVEARLGLQAVSSRPPGPDLIGHHASGVAAILTALSHAPVTAEDVFVDVGSGLGKVVLLARLLTGATVRGIELQPELAETTRRSATRLGLDVTVDVGDAREARIDDGTVFFLYLPFTGEALRRFLARLEDVARRRPVVVCTLGLDLDREAPWLQRRPDTDFWVAIYDGAFVARPPRSAPPLLASRAARAIAGGE